MCKRDTVPPSPIGESPEIITIITMGNSAAGPESSTGQDDSRFDGIETLGYRVLGVQPNSPASAAGLVSFLDFLVGANGMMLFNVDGDDDINGEEGTESAEKKKKNEDDEYYVDIDFPAFLKQNMDTEIELCTLTCMLHVIFIYTPTL